MAGIRLTLYHRPYHSAIIKENWKIIYRYDEANDLVIFVDLWDMRRSPRYTLQEEQPTPIGWHPANEEEAVARIEAIEAEYERTGISYSVEEFFNKLNEERTWLK